ncbi:MAG TPA: ATP-binding protein [Candidatus Deferrimicrobiaceae bacterium]
MDTPSAPPFADPPRASLAVFRTILILFLVLSSVVVLRATGLYTRKAQALAEASLGSTALALSASAENALRSGGAGEAGDIRTLFADQVVAYALIAREDGTVLFHTNPLMVGTRLSGAMPAGLLRQPGKSSGRRVTLGTGLPAYEFDHVLRSKEGGQMLRIVLHTTQADAIAAGGKTMWESVGGLLFLLWTAGILVERLLTRHFRLRAEADRRERLALIGQMTATLAHEIRNAIGGVKGFAQWVDEKVDGADPRKKGLAAILEGSRRIEGLVDDLLRFSKEETYEIGTVELDGIVQTVIKSEASGWAGRLEAEAGRGLFVKADAEKLRRVLVNGVRNALQAMGDAGVLRVTARGDGGWAEIRIEDTGPGIAASEAPRLFTPFYTTRVDGTGLGLAYSRKVIEGMGGSIDLSNREDGRGAAFVVRLPKGKREGAGHVEAHPDRR